MHRCRMQALSPFSMKRLRSLVLHPSCLQAFLQWADPLLEGPVRAHAVFRSRWRQKAWEWLGCSFKAESFTEKQGPHVRKQGFKSNPGADSFDVPEVGGKAALLHTLFTSPPFLKGSFCRHTFFGCMYPECG